jgi:hypothetical protein
MHYLLHYARQQEQSSTNGEVYEDRNTHKAIDNKDLQSLGLALKVRVTSVDIDGFCRKLESAYVKTGTDLKINHTASQLHSSSCGI